MSEPFKAPKISVGETVVWRDLTIGLENAMVVTEVCEKIVRGVRYTTTGGLAPCSYAYHKDDPELDARPILRKSVWDLSETRKRVEKLEEFVFGEHDPAPVAKAVIPAMPDFVDEAPDSESGKEEAFRQVKKLFLEGISLKEIARVTKVHHKTVEKITKELQRDRPGEQVEASVR